MAQRTVVTLEDDLVGGAADETVRFAIGGREYEIDLSTANAERFRQQLGTYIQYARRAGNAARRPVRTAASRRRSRDIRVWAQERGIEISERGRIPANVVDQYEAETSRRLGHVLPVPWPAAHPPEGRTRRPGPTGRAPRYAPTAASGGAAADGGRRPRAA
jgi:nucleoid-associated protein Lsr2